MRNVNKIIIEKVYYPVYIIVEAFLSGEILHYIKNIPGVIRNPIPMKKQDITDLFLSEAIPKNTISFSLGEKVKVIEGPFTVFFGTIETINEERQRMSITVLIFGRKTLLDIKLSQGEKL